MPSEIPEDIQAMAKKLFDLRDSIAFRGFIAQALLTEREATEKRIGELLKDQVAVRVNWLRGGINATSIIDEIQRRDASLADEYADSYEKGLCHYGAADKDHGRGRQEGHIKAGRDIAAAIRQQEPPK